MQELPFQEGKPLSRFSKEGEGSTELVEYSHTAESSPDCQVYTASLCNADDDEPNPECDAELLADMSTDEPKTPPKTPRHHVCQNLLRRSSRRAKAHRLRDGHLQSEV
jgi:hypothetical protein